MFIKSHVFHSVRPMQRFTQFASYFPSERRLLASLNSPPPSALTQYPDKAQVVFARKIVSQLSLTVVRKRRSTRRSNATGRGFVSQLANQISYSDVDQESKDRLPSSLIRLGSLAKFFADLGRRYLNARSFQREGCKLPFLPFCLHPQDWR